MKVVKKEDFKKKFWAPFRVPTGTDQEIIKNPWVQPWFREKGKKDFWFDLRFKGNIEKIPVDITEKDDNYLISADIPNVTKKDITVEAAEKNLIMIADSKNIAKSGRAIKFKNNIKPEKAKAKYENNKLKIEIPKKGKVIEAAGKKIETKK